jgi:hypothetical protein
LDIGSDFLLPGDSVLAKIVKGETMACKGCERRRQWIKTVIGGAVASFIIPKTIWAYQTVTGNTAFPHYFALGLMRTLNTSQVGNAIQKKGIFDNKAGFVAGVLHHQTHAVGIPELAYMSSLNMADWENVLPGWRLDWFGTPTGYVTIIEQKDGGIAFVSDQEGGIYAATTAGVHPAAKDLGKASLFPGAIPLFQYLGAMQQYLKSPLRDIAYRGPRSGDLCTGCAPDKHLPIQDCVYCVTNCCGMTCWASRPPSQYDIFNCGQPNLCLWGGLLDVDCDPAICTQVRQCAAKWFLTCVYCNHTCHP